MEMSDNGAVPILKILVTKQQEKRMPNAKIF